MADENDKDKGLYGKYYVERVDGGSKIGAKHEHCSYFVLDLDHDKYAKDALRAYANACQSEYPQLSKDLREMTDGPSKE